MEAAPRQPLKEQQQAGVLSFDGATAFEGALERPCSSGSAESLSASEAFSTAALDCDTSEGQAEEGGRLPGEHMQVRDSGSR